ncbi:unnamed protein product [Toxocara canis]|uniref:C2H2-type domain-containing protein n=1 Tax=Toxocara canis TaxID=6265 RepID=A0A183V433_TOXCA|nr:unnamed protein product [Toxocara canis]
MQGGFIPHACRYCGKTCQLKGNLKKHLKIRISTEEELEKAWNNRRPPARIPNDAIIVRTEPFFTPPSQPRKRKLGLRSDARIWMYKIRKGELLPSATISEKMVLLEGEMAITWHSDSALETNFCDLGLFSSFFSGLLEDLLFGRATLCGGALKAKGGMRLWLSQFYGEVVMLSENGGVLCAFRI